MRILLLPFLRGEGRGGGPPIRITRYTRESGYPVRRGFSIRPPAALEYEVARSSRARTAVIVAPSRAQRIGILDHIGPAAGGGARREQHEPRGREYGRRKIAAHRQIVRDILIGGIAQPRQRYMRRELAPLGIKPEALHQPLEFGLQLDQWPAWHHGARHRPRLAPAETRQALQRNLERLAIDSKQQRGDFVRRDAIDIADEPQGDVIIFGIDPACAWKAATQIGKGLADF